jgi:ABC-type Mn2+/Zn2+ transport system permease subunit
MPASALALSIAMAIAAGLVGASAMRRMTLASDAISHVAAEIGLALAFGLHPAVGSAAALPQGAVLIWLLGNRTRIATETLIASSSRQRSRPGPARVRRRPHRRAVRLSGMTRGELVIGLAGAGAVVAFILAARNRLLVALVSPDIARTAGIDVRRLDLLYLLAFALTVALGLRYLGVLLMGSLIIIPAATAKYFARSLRGMFCIAVGAAVFATVVGDALATRLDRPTGPLIVVVAAAVFFASLVVRRVP